MGEVMCLQRDGDSGLLVTGREMIISHSPIVSVSVHLYRSESVHSQSCTYAGPKIGTHRCNRHTAEADGKDGFGP